jgi:hypothetical protein
MVRNAGEVEIFLRRWGTRKEFKTDTSQTRLLRLFIGHRYLWSFILNCNLLFLIQSHIYKIV